MIDNEVNNILRRYERRKMLDPERYSIFNPWMLKHEQDKEKNIIKVLKEKNMLPVSDKRFLEIGCGDGSSLLWFIKVGFTPGNMIANELISERAEFAKRRIPTEINIYNNNALELDLEKESFDIIYQSLVFSSILDESFQQRLADKMLELLKNTGGILWYDFIYNNPFNPDVKGISIKKIRKLFPDTNIYKLKISLAPPIARFVSKVYPGFYDLFNLVKPFRTHFLCWISKK